MARIATYFYHTVVDRIENQTTFIKDNENNEDDDALMTAAEVDSLAFHNQIDELGTQINELGISFAHQMGSCRMGANPFSFRVPSTKMVNCGTRTVCTSWMRVCFLPPPVQIQ